MTDGEYNYSKLTITGEEFIRIWNGDYKDQPDYSHYYHKLPIEVSEKDNTISYGPVTLTVVFRFITIVGEVNISEKAEPYLPIRIAHCEFVNQFTIRGGVFLGIYIGTNILENHFLNGVNIFGGNFQNGIFLNGIGKYGHTCKITFFSCVFETKVRIWSACNVIVQIYSGRFSDGISFGGSFESITIEGGRFDSDIEIENCIVQKNIQIIGYSQSKRLEDSESELWRVGELNSSKLFFDNSGIFVKGRLFIRNFFFVAYVKVDYLKFQHDHAEDRTDDNVSYINYLHLLNFENSLFIDSVNLANFTINSLTFENCIMSKDSIIHLDSLNLNQLEFKNSMFVSSILFRNIVGQDRKLIRTPILNSDTVFSLVNKLIGENDIPSFKIIGTDMGKTLFINCDFSKFRFIFNHSKLVDIFLAGSEMPNKISGNDVTNYYEEQLGYGQIKKVHELRGDFLKSSEFSFKEIQSYHRFLSSRKEKVYDRFTLWLNDVTSNHGQSWIRAFLCIVIFGTFSFTLLCYSLGYRVDLNNGTLSTFFSASAYFFTFINPIRKVGAIDLPGNWTPLSEAIDGTSRIVTAYLIYQFIQAFRKYGRHTK